MVEIFDLTCPTTGELVRAYLEGSTFGTRTEIDLLRPETQVWWSEVVREYALLQTTNPESSPRSIVEDVVQGWARDRRSTDHR